MRRKWPRLQPGSFAGRHKVAELGNAVMQRGIGRELWNWAQLCLGRVDKAFVMDEPC